MVQDIIDGISGFFGSLGVGVSNGVVGFLGDFFGGIGSSIVDLLINLLSTLINIILFPIDALITSIFPNFSEFISTFSEGLTRFVSAPIGYFAYHIPPISRGVILLYLTIMLGYYSIIWTYRGIILIPTVIRKIKFW